MDALVAIATAEVMGQQAFVNGKSSAPAQDPRVVALVAKFSSPDFFKAPIILAILKAWGTGWHNANLAGDIQ